MNRHQMRQVDLGIDLCRGEGAVAEELLDRAKVHSRLQKMGGESVTQRVRMEMVEIRSVADGVVELPADRPIAEAASALVDEKGFTLAGDTATPTGAFGEIDLEGLPCWPAERDEALFAPLAAHSNHPLTELDISEVKGHEFANAEPCGVKKLHRRAVTAPCRGVRKSFEKFLDYVTFGNFRCALDVVGVGHGICWARLEGALGYQKAEKGPERGERSRNGARLETARVEQREVGPHGYGCRLRGLFVMEFRGDEIDKREDLTAVGAEGCGREIAFPLKVFQKWIDQPGAEVAITSTVTHSSASGRGESLPKALHHHRRNMSLNISIECLTAITREASI